MYLLLFLLFDFDDIAAIVGADTAVGEVEDGQEVGWFPNRFSPEDDDGTGVTCKRRWEGHRSSTGWWDVGQ